MTQENLFDMPEIQLPETSLDVGFMGGDFNMDDFQQAETDDFEKESRYCRPKLTQFKTLVETHAKDLAKKIVIPKNSSTYLLLSGTFTLGNFFFELIGQHNLHVLKMHIASLSIDPQQIIEFKNLLEGEYVNELDLHLSHFFYVHERKRMLPLLRENLDIENRFQLAFSQHHIKICLMELEDGRKITIHGSGNLRSSRSIEQIEITENQELYEFNRDFLDKIMVKYKTINKSVRFHQVVD